MISDVEILENGLLSLGLAPQHGGAIAWLKWNGIDLLRPLSAINNNSIPVVRLSSGYPLIPYSNRIADGSFTWNGQAFALAKNFGDHPHSIHGFGWQRAWKLKEIDIDSVVMQFIHFADDDWPWDCKATQSIKITDKSVLLTLTLTNLANTAMPAGLGWHPYFMRSQNMQVQFSAQNLWSMNEQSLPDQMITIPDFADFSHLKAIGNPNLDHCYSGWDGKVMIEYPEHKLAVTLTTHDCDYLVFFTPIDKDFVAIEPVTHLNNAINFDNPELMGIKNLNPKEQMTLSIEMVIQKQHEADE